MKHPGQLKKQYILYCDLTDSEITNRLEFLNSEEDRQINYLLMASESWAYVNNDSYFTLEYIVRGKRNIKVQGVGVVKYGRDGRKNIEIKYETSGFGTFFILLFFLISICTWLGVAYVFVNEFFEKNSISYPLILAPVIFTLVYFFLKSSTSSEIIDLHDKVTKALKQEL